MKVKKESEKAGLKLNIQKTKIMASSPITSRQIDVGKLEIVADFIFLDSKITADGDYSHEKTLVPWKKSYNKLRQHTKMQRLYFVDKDPYSQSYDFSSCHAWMWNLDHKEGWAPKNWCFQTVILEKTLKFPWIANISSQSFLKEINPEYSLEGLMLKL